jgi:hypothetical protein
MVQTNPKGKLFLAGTEISLRRFASTINLGEFSERYDIGSIRDKYFNFKRLGKRWTLLWRHCLRKNIVRTIPHSQSCHGL